MRKNDLYVFADHAYQVADHPDTKTKTVKLRMVAGPDDEPRRQTVQASILAGRDVYRLVPAIDDVDLDHAREEVVADLDVGDFAHDARKWTSAFCQRFSSRPTPDQTIMLGWFATAIEAGVQAGRDLAEQEHKRRSVIAKRAADKRRNEQKKLAARRRLAKESKS